MVDNSIDADVLIVGAGQVGLFLANECARRKYAVAPDRGTRGDLSIIPVRLGTYPKRSLFWILRIPTNCNTANTNTSSATTPTTHFPCVLKGMTNIST